MSIIIDEFHINQYTVLKLDRMPEKMFRKYRIGGIEFDPVPIYDTPQCIAIHSEESFVGEMVEFI